MCLQKQEDSRKTSFTKEFRLLFERFMKLGFRAPIGLIAVFAMAMGNSFIICSVFGGVM